MFKDTLGNFHRLPMEYYLPYGFRMGQTTDVVIIRYQPNGECVFEPVHPVYKIGEEYSFAFTGMHKTVDLFGRIEAVMTVTDVFGQEIRVKPDEWQIAFDQYTPAVIRCRVNGFRKGRPILENMEN
jgi:hypothetical protein